MITIVRSIGTSAVAVAVILTVILAGAAHASVSGRWAWDVRTCDAWDGHRVASVVFADSRRADTFLRVDVRGWYDRWRRHDRSTRTWAGYVDTDCATLDGYGE